MKEQIVSRRVLSLCVALLVAVPLGAQQSTPPDAAQQRLMFQVQTFEGILQNAVKHGAEVLAQKFAEQVPGVQLTSIDPEAKGFSMPTPEGGYFFVVIIPVVRGIVPYLVQQNPRQGPGRPFPPRPGTQSVGSQAVPTADPVTVSPTIPDGGPTDPLDPNVEYSKAVANALIDAVIDNSGGLPLKETEWLTVAAIDGVVTPGVINSAFGHTLYISVKGSDLSQFRQQKISRDDLRKLVNVKQN
jgi:hypothetical protein